MDKILIIGNGFDLYHGKLTKYAHFLSFIDRLNKNEIDGAEKYKKVINEYFKNVVPSYNESSLLNYLLNQYNFANDRGNWIDLEHDIKQYIRNILLYFNGVNEGDSRKRALWFSTGFVKSKNDEFTSVLLETSTSLFPTHWEKKYNLGEQYKTVLGKIDIEKVLAQLERELSSISRLLTYYLSEIEPIMRGRDVPRKSLFASFDFDKVISFNYTSTAQDVYGYDKSKIFYPHGSLEKENIILGYNDDDGDYVDLAFKKYYRRLVNSTDIIDVKGFRRSYAQEGLPVTKYSTLYFFGHSLDVSDIDLLKEFFLVKNKVVIYYTDEIDRANKIANIIKLVDKEKAIERIRKNEISFLPIPDEKI